MYKYSLLLCLAFAGCVSFEVPPSQQPQNTQAQKQLLCALDQVKVGMTLDQVKNILGNEVIIGFQKMTEAATQAVTLPAPYRQETISADGKFYQVLFYFTNVEKADTLVSEEELTPLVFLNGALLSLSRDEYDNLKKRAQ